ncbi:MAG TPA: VOC family protein [Thermomicrobiales bacterium]|nr:VOC family protein [Thermomicrobiales bacterium]
MPSMLDHIVIVDRDLDTMVQQAESLGFTVVPGGQHAGGTTHNALIAFRDGSYIELIAFIDPEQRSTHRWWTRLWKGGGLVDFALFCSDLEADVAEIRDRGLEIDEPVENGRLRPDGERLEWRQSFPQEIAGESGLPFLIEDITPRSLRVPSEEDQVTHRNGVTGIAGLTLLVDDLGNAVTALEAITGNAAETIDPPFLGITAAQRITIGHELGQWVVVATPDMDQRESVGEEGLPAKYLEKYGLGPFSAVLTTGAAPADLAPDAGTEIDLQLLAASRLRIA